MPPRAIVPVLFAVVAPAVVARTRLQRGRRLMVLRGRPNRLRWISNAALLRLAVIGSSASLSGARGQWDAVASLSVLLLGLSDMGFDLCGRPQPGQCALHEHGMLMFDR